MQIRSYLQACVSHLTNFTETPLLDAELLLGHALNVTRTTLYTWPDKSLTQQQIACTDALIARRLRGEPIAYIIGCWEFWSLPFKITPDTLVPRPETETLVTWVLEHFPDQGAINCLELGTGSGAIALAMASERAHWQITACDISDAALAVAEENKCALALTQVSFCQSNWFSNITTDSFDLIVSNPPYIADTDPSLKQPTLHFEPACALSAGKNGLDALQSIVQSAPDFLNPGAWLALEHGCTQADAVNTLMKMRGFAEVDSLIDLNGDQRIAIARYH